MCRCMRVLSSDRCAQHLAGDLCCLPMCQRPGLSKAAFLKNPAAPTHRSLRTLNPLLSGGARLAVALAEGRLARRRHALHGLAGARRTSRHSACDAPSSSLRMHSGMVGVEA